MGHTRMANRLENKVAVVTGGNSGIGEDTAALFAEEGARIILMARREAEGREVEARIKASGGDAKFIPCDVGDVESVSDAIELAAKTYGRIDVLFNNAGGGGGGNFPNESDEEWNRVVNVNLTGTFYVSRAVWPHLVEAGAGTVVNMSSLAAQRGFSPRMQDEFGATSASYYAAKAGVDALTRYMAGAGGRHNIRVNCLAPGAATRMTASVPGSRFDADAPPPPEMDPALVTPAVLFMCSEEAPSANTIHASGGRYSRSQTYTNQGVSLGTDATFDDLIEQTESVCDMSASSPFDPLNRGPR